MGGRKPGFSQNLAAHNEVIYSSPLWKDQSPADFSAGLSFFQTYTILLLRRQIFIFSASLIKSSRKSGCASLMSFSVRAQVEAAFIDSQPYSVTTICTICRGTVVMLPLPSVGTIRERISPSLVLNVEGRQIKLRPPFDQNAPRVKSDMPPLPEICLNPELSAFTCVYRSICRA